MEDPPLDDTRARPASGGRALLALTAAALLVRAGFLLLEPATQPVADERTWTDWAVENLVTPKVSFSPFRTHLIFYPPLYPYFIAVFYALFGILAAVKWAQVAVAALLVPAVGRVGFRSFGPRVGVIAGALAAFYPELVWFSVHFWSETLFMVLLWWAVERLLAADAHGGRGVAAVAGVLWGLSILTRETALYFTPVAALWLAVNRRRAGGPARGAFFLLTALLTVAPWTYRNWVVFRALVPVSTAGGLNLFQGNARLSRQEVYDLVDAVQGRVEQYHYARRMGLEAIRQRQPTWIFEKLRDELPNFWEADSLALIHVKRGAYGDVSRATAVAAGLLVLLPYVCVLALMVAGLATLRSGRAAVFLLLFLAYYTGIHVATHGFARYRLPVMPVVVLLAALGWVRWREGSLRIMSPARKALAVTLALVLAVCLVPSLRRNWAHPVFGFANQGGPPGEEPPPP